MSKVLIEPGTRFIQYFWIIDIIIFSGILLGIIYILMKRAIIPLFFLIFVIISLIIGIIGIISHRIITQRRISKSVLMRITEDSIEILNKQSEIIKNYPLTKIDKIGIEYDSIEGNSESSGNFIFLTILQGKNSDNYIVEFSWAINTSSNLVNTLEKLGFYSFPKDDTKNLTFWFRKLRKGESLPPTSRYLKSQIIESLKHFFKKK